MNKIKIQDTSPGKIHKIYRYYETIERHHNM